MKRIAIISAILTLLAPAIVGSQSLGGYYGPVISGPVFYDTFTGDVADLTSHTPDITPGPGWTVIAAHLSGTGGISITSGKALATATSAAYYGIAYSDVGITNVAISSEVTTINSPNVANNGLLLRFSDSDNFITCDLGTTSNYIRLLDCNTSTYTARDSKTVTVAPNTQYSISGIVNGNALSCTMGGVTSSYTYTFLTGNTIRGIMTGAVSGQTGTRHDNFIVSAY